MLKNMNSFQLLTQAGFASFCSLIGKKVFSVPEESLGGDENVLAVCDGGQLENKVTNSASRVRLLNRFVVISFKNVFSPKRFCSSIFHCIPFLYIYGFWLFRFLFKFDLKHFSASFASLHGYTSIH